MKTRVLVVEDERTALQALSLLLEDEGYEVMKAETGEEGLCLALQAEPHLILLDVRLPDVDGITVLQRLRAGYCDAAVVIMTAETTSSNAIRATQHGAFDYVSKPINDEHLLLLIRRALEYRTLEKEVHNLRKVAPPAPPIPGIVGHSLPMQEVYKMIGRVANSNATVLITGESGTGKELVANAIHEFSPRAGAPLIKVNCAAIPDNLLEAELFGHEKGAFTSAVARHIGRFEQADGGTLFLDEIAELSIESSGKTPASDSGANYRTAGRWITDFSRFSANRGHGSRLGASRLRRPLSRGPLLPAQRRHHRTSGTKETEGGHPAAGPTLSQPVGTARDPPARRLGPNHGS